MFKKLLVCSALFLAGCGHDDFFGDQGNQREITFTHKYAKSRLEAVSDEPKIYTFRSAEDYFKIQEGRTYKCYLIGAQTSIYDVGEEVK